jgi:hypothetical protein
VYQSFPQVWLLVQKSLTCFWVKRGNDWPVQGVTAAEEQAVLHRAPIADNLVRSKSDLPLGETISPLRT